MTFVELYILGCLKLGPFYFSEKQAFLQCLKKYCYQESPEVCLQKKEKIERCHNRRREHLLKTLEDICEKE